MVAACVATNIEFKSRLDWSQRHLLSSGDCTTTTTTTTSTTPTTTTTTNAAFIDFSVANQTIFDKFVVIEPFIVTEPETRTKSASCDETSNVAIKFMQFDTSASLVLTTHTGESILSKTLLLCKSFKVAQHRHYGQFAQQSNPLVQMA